MQYSISLEMIQEVGPTGMFLMGEKKQESWQSENYGRVRLSLLDDNYHQNRTTAEKRVAATTPESCRIKDQSIY